MAIRRSNAREPEFKIQALEQFCLVVPHLQSSMESMWHNFGVGPWKVFHYPSSDLSDMMYHGKPGRFGMSLAMAAAGTLEIELIQPTEGESTYTDFLKEHAKGGVHHLGWYKVKNLADTIQLMGKAGFPCLTSGRTYRSQFAYFDTVKVLGVILEAICKDESIPVRLPDCVWPE